MEKSGSLSTKLNRRELGKATAFVLGHFGLSIAGGSFMAYKIQERDRNCNANQVEILEGRKGPKAWQAKTSPLKTRRDLLRYGRSAQQEEQHMEKHYDLNPEQKSHLERMVKRQEEMDASVRQDLIGGLLSTPALGILIHGAHEATKKTE